MKLFGATLRQPTPKESVIALAMVLGGVLLMVLGVPIIPPVIYGIALGCGIQSIIVPAPDYRPVMLAYPAAFFTLMGIGVIPFVLYAWS